MKYRQSKEYKNADVKKIAYFVGLKSQPYEGSSFIIDSHDARLIVANLRQNEYSAFKTKFQNSRSSSFRLLQDFESNRKKTLSADEMFKIRYPNGGKNFMTPRIIKRGKINRNVAYELSSGDGIGGGSMYGVTVLILNPDGSVTSSDNSKSFSSYESAISYINMLKVV